MKQIINLVIAICLCSQVQAQTSTQYTYDPLNRITAIQYPDGTSVQYSYQPNGNRSTKIVSAVSGLPIELTQFEAEKDSRPMTVKTTWQTSVEINASHFELEWSKDGGSTFSKIGERTAKGNTTTTQYYHCPHENPVVGWNYYRLKCLDLDGTFIYSQVKVVEFEVPNFDNAIIYPNPTSEDATLQYTELVENASLTLLDISGKVIWTKEIQKRTTSEQIPLTKLPSGSYVLKLQLNSQDKPSKVFKIEKI